MVLDARLICPPAEVMTRVVPAPAEVPAFRLMGLPLFATRLVPERDEPGPIARDAVSVGPRT